MRLAFLLTLYLLSSVIPGFGQEAVIVPDNTGQYCNFTGSKLLQIKGIYTFTSEEEAREVLNKMLLVVGLKPNFVVQAASVPNAAAWINHNRRYILYNPQFILSVRQSTQTDWSAISILAHEIGHHLNGHTLTLSPDRHQNEIDADEFSGFVLRKMGAGLAESQAAIQLLISPRGSETHPGRDRRLQAVQEGWLRADDFMVKALDELHAAKEEPGAEPTPDRLARASTRSPAPPAFAAWRVILSRNPQNQYYITRENAFVVLREGSVKPLGKLMPNSDARFPFLIRIDNSPNLMVSKDMQLVTQSGKTVGKLNRL